VIALTTLLRDAWARARTAPPGVAALPVRQAAVAVALETWGEGRVTSLPELINLGAWSWLSRERAIVHTVRPSVPRLVASTDLHQLPDAPPALLAAPWCVEVGRPERGERLWGETWALAGYTLDGTTYLIGLDGEGAHVVPWRPRWSGRELAAGVDTRVMDDVLAELGLVGTVEGAPAHAAWAVEAVRWAVTYAVLLDAAGSPVRVSEEAPPRERTPAKQREARDWSVSRITLTPDGERIVAPSAGETGTGEAPDTTGRTAAKVTVRGHLKRQRYGQGNAQVRWIYVEGYDARRWVAPWTTRDVGAGKPS
jgi:hypothetical protein